MAIDTKKKLIKQVRERKYLNKDFDALKADLLDYSRTYFPNQMQDFSEASLGGMFLDLASYVGDVQSFYLDHQFQELDPTTAVESSNIERHLRNAGVPIVGSAPAVVACKFLIEVPSVDTPAVPNPEALPIIREGTIARADNGTLFELTEDLDFSSVDQNGNSVAQISIGTKNTQNVPTSFILTMEGLCLSGFRNTETFTIGSFQPFMRFVLSKENVTEVLSVFDGQGNQYYEVEYLTQDTVYKAIPNRNEDNKLVEDNLTPIPAPYRFITNTALNTRLTSLILGGGSAATTDNDIIPDPSAFAVPLYGKKVFSRFTINPGNMLQTQTLGSVAPNTTLVVTYRYGGGLNHNVPVNAIRDITSLNISFPMSPTNSVSQFVRTSVDVVNEERSSGGDDPPSVNELKARVPAIRAAQSRIVTKEDLIARVYTMPANFGRVFRAAVHPNLNNPLASRLFVISRDANSKLIITPDSLKTNLAKYINEFRLISDAIDILDAQIINLKIDFSVVIDPAFANNRNIILQNVIKKLRNYFNVKNFNLDQPIILGDLQNLIYNNQGILSVNEINVSNLHGDVGSSNPREYSSIQYDIEVNTEKGIIFGPPGSIFEVRFPNFDIVGTAV